MSDENRAGEKDWLKRTRQTLDDSEEEIDGVTLGRLRAARREALSRARPKPAWQRPRYWVPATGVALALLVAGNLNLLNSQGEPEPDSQTASLLEDLPILSGEDNLELLDDLEFYLWVADAEQELG